MSLAAIGIGALIGAGTSWAMGGDPAKGAMYGAAGGGVGGGYAAMGAGVAPSATAGAMMAGGAVGGVAGGVGSTLVGGAPKLKVPQTPIGTTTLSVGYASEAERQRRKRRKGYGSTILAGGELGVSAATQRRQILG